MIAAIFHTSGESAMNDIIATLASQFGISAPQAESAAGSLFKLVQDKAASGDFQQLLTAVPQVGDWIAKAGAAGGGSAGGGLLGGLGGALGGALGGGSGDLGALLAAVQKSGLKPETLAQFVPALLQLVATKVDPALIEKLVAAVPALKQLGGASGGAGLGSVLGGLLGGR